MKLLYGTGNPAKLEAMRRRLSGLGLEIVGLNNMEGGIPGKKIRKSEGQIP